MLGALPLLLASWVEAAMLADASTAGRGDIPLAGRIATETWAGHLVLQGERHVPVLGTLPMRTDSWVVAQVQRSEKGLRLEQRACRVEVAPVARVRVRFSAAALPPSVAYYRPVAGGSTLRGSARHRWGREDVDRDGSTVCAAHGFNAGRLLRPSHPHRAGWSDTGLRWAAAVAVVQHRR